MPRSKADRPLTPAAPFDKRTTRSSSRLASARPAQSDAPPSSTSPGPSTAAHADLEAPKANKKATKPARQRDARSSSSPPHIGSDSPGVTSTKTNAPSRDASPAPVESASKSPSEFSPGAAQTLCVRLPSSKDSDHRYEIDITIGLRRCAAPQFAGAADKLAANSEDAKSSAGPSENKQSTIVLVEVPLVMDTKTGRKSLGALLNIPDGPIQGWIGSLAKELGKSIVETLKLNIDAAPSVKGKGKERAFMPPPQRPTPAFYGKAFCTEPVAPTTDDNAPVANDTCSPVASSSRVTLDTLNKKRPADENEDVSTPAKKPTPTSSSSESDQAGSSSASSPPTSVNESVASEADTSSPVASSSRVTLDMLSKKRPAEENEDVSAPAKKAKTTSSSSESNTASLSSSSPPTSTHSGGESTKVNPLGGFAKYSATPATFPSIEGAAHGRRARPPNKRKTTSASSSSQGGSSSSSPPTSIQSSGGSTKINPLGGFAQFSTTPATFPTPDGDAHGRRARPAFASTSQADKPRRKLRSHFRRNAGAANDASASNGDRIDLSVSREEDEGRGEAPAPAPASQSRTSSKRKRASDAPRDVDAADGLAAPRASKSAKRTHAAHADDEGGDKPAPAPRSGKSGSRPRDDANPRRPAPAASQSRRRPATASQERPVRRAAAPAPVRAQDDNESRALVASTSRRAASPAPAGHGVGSSTSQTVFDSQGGYLSMQGGRLPPPRDEDDQELQDIYRELAGGIMGRFAAEAGSSWSLVRD
ncbi:hypothetical protein JCM10449v2_003095 [Rhodotorula kratochvilovae]